MAKAGRMRWYGPKIIKEVEGEVQRRLKLAAEAVTAQAKRNVSIPTSTAGPSQPGEFPHADTGRLRQSIMWEIVSKHVARVGTPLKYGLYLEFLMNRSYLRRTLIEMRPILKRIFTAKMK